MAKTLFETFYDEFSKEVRQSKNYPEAFEKASAKFQDKHGFPAFNSYETFRRRKKKT